MIITSQDHILTLELSPDDIQKLCSGHSVHVHSDSCSVLLLAPRKPADVCRVQPADVHRIQSAHEKLCEHGVGHPYPKKLEDCEGLSVHGCDGCCRELGFFEGEKS